MAINWKQRLESFFSPNLSLVKRGVLYFPNRLSDGPLLRQFMEEAGLGLDKGNCVTACELDLILEVCGKHELSLETIGDEDEGDLSPM